MDAHLHFVSSRGRGHMVPGRHCQLGVQGSTREDEITVSVRSAGFFFFVAAVELSFFVLLLVLFFFVLEDDFLRLALFFEDRLERSGSARTKSL